VYLLIPWGLPGQVFERDLILLVGQPQLGARTVEGSGVQAEEDRGYQMHGGNTTEEKWRG
jgi:hypothetical protein